MHEVWVGHIFWSPVWIFTVVPPKISFYLFGWNEHLQGLLDEELQALMGDSQDSQERRKKNFQSSWIHSMKLLYLDDWKRIRFPSFLFWGGLNFELRIGVSVSHPRHPEKPPTTIPGRKLRRFLDISSQPWKTRPPLCVATCVQQKLSWSSCKIRRLGVGLKAGWVAMKIGLFLDDGFFGWSFFLSKCVWVSRVFTFFLEKVDIDCIFSKHKLWNEKNDNCEKKKQFSGCIPDVCKPVTVQCWHWEEHFYLFELVDVGICIYNISY